LTSRNVGGMLHDSVISRDVLCHGIVNVWQASLQQHCGGAFANPPDIGDRDDA